jgi:DNA-binding NarL/FixJ family response regulator
MGQTWASSEQIGSVLDAFARVAPPVLTDKAKAPLSRREREVAELVAEGFSNREISAQLGLSQHTIKNYLFHIYEKLGMSSRVDLVLYIRSVDRPSADEADSLGEPS